MAVGNFMRHHLIGAFHSGGAKSKLISDLKANLQLFSFNSNG